MPRPPEGATGISSGALVSEVSARAINGPRIFVATSITDVGYVLNRFDRDPGAPPIRSCFVEGVFVEGDDVARINRDIKLSFDERSNLVALITAARGGQPPEDEEQVDPGEIIGIPIQVAIESSPRKRDGGFWLSMKAPSALMDGVTIPACLKSFTELRSTSFAWKTEEQLASIRTSLGAASPARGDSGGEEYDAYDSQDDRPPHDEPDDLPF